MRYSVFKTIVFLFAVVVAVIFINRYFFNFKINNFGALLFQKQSAYLFSKLESVNSFFKKAIQLKKIISDNEKLTKENIELLSRIADYEDIKSENDFLRKSLNISSRLHRKVIYANIYQFQLGLKGYDVLIDKGAGDGIIEGDTVITEAGALIGKIKMTDQNFSRLVVVSDTDFSVTAKVLSSDTAGIARGALDQGLSFELIVQKDEIKEGDLVVSSGMDIIPPALLLGTVSFVETKDTDLFKKIKIKPAIDGIKIGRVLIIRKNDQN